MHVRRSTDHHQVRARQGGGVGLVVRNHSHVAERLQPLGNRLCDRTSVAVDRLECDDRSHALDATAPGLMRHPVRSPIRIAGNY